MFSRKYNFRPLAAETATAWTTDAESPGDGGGGYSLYSDERDDRRIF